MKSLLALFCIAVLFAAAPVSAVVTSSENLLAVGNYNVNQGSSDLGTVVQLEADDGTIVIDEGARVTYFFNQSDNNLDGVTDWMLDSYDDSAWESGISGVGYNSIQTTDVGDTDDQGAIYTRYRFSAPEGTTGLTIRIDYDDGVVVWLNGVEVLRANMTTDAAVPNWDWGQSENHESTNKLGPDPTRWEAPVSNLFGVGEDNPENSIIEYTFAAELVTAVEPEGKLATAWAGLKR